MLQIIKRIFAQIGKIVAMLIITVKTKQMIKKGIEKLFSQPISIIKNDL